MGSPLIRIKTDALIAVIAASATAQTAPNILFVGEVDVAHVLATRIAHLRGVGLRVVELDDDQRPEDLAAVLTNIEPHDLVFVGNAQHMSAEILDILRQAVCDHTLPIVIGEGASARQMTLDIQPFTILAQATDLDRLTEEFQNALEFITDTRFLAGRDDACRLAGSATLKNLLAVPASEEPSPAFDAMAEVHEIINGINAIVEAAVARDHFSLAAIALDEFRRRFETVYALDLPPKQRELCRTVMEIMENKSDLLRELSEEE